VLGTVGLAGFQQQCALETCPLQCVTEALQTCANSGEITVDPPLRLNSNVMTTSNPLWHF